MREPIKINFTDHLLSKMDDGGKRTDLPPGDAEWLYEAGTVLLVHLLFICPCGCSKIRIVPVSGDRKWNWDGNKELPTLTPSILIVGECGWHGYLTNGVFTTC